MKSLWRGLSVGWAAVKKNWLPALILQVIMVGLGWGYISGVSWIYFIFEKLAHAKEVGGYLFSFTAGAVAAGVVSEIFRVYFVDGGKWQRHHVVDMVFKMALMGSLSIMTDRFYQLQGVWFGSGTDWMTLHKKVAVDMIGYSFFVAWIQTVLFLWKDEGFVWSRAVQKLKPLMTYFLNQFVPLWVSNICFWLPIVYVIYSMPLLLQMPLNLIAITIWGILIVTVTQESRKG